MRIKFKNARILTMDNNFEILDGVLITNENKIEYIGKEDREGQFDRIIECNGNLLMPGFKKRAHSFCYDFCKKLCG